MPLETEDLTGTPRPRRDILAALAFIEAEMLINPMRMGPRETGPAVMHCLVIREVLKAALETARE